MHPPADKSWAEAEGRPKFRSTQPISIFESWHLSSQIGIVQAAVDYFKGNGWAYAAQLLDHFLGNKNVDDVFHTPTDQMRKLIGVHPKIGSDDNDATWGQYNGAPIIDTCLSLIKEEAWSNIANSRASFGQKQEITKEWVPAQRLYGADWDLHSALGGFWMGVGADITVYDKEKYTSSNLGHQYSMSHAVYIFDFYYFHDTVKGLLGRTEDLACQACELYGAACSFIHKGEYSDGSVEIGYYE